MPKVAARQKPGSEIGDAVGLLISEVEFSSTNDRTSWAKRLEAEKKPRGGRQRRTISDLGSCAAQRGRDVLQLDSTDLSRTLNPAAGSRNSAALPNTDLPVTDPNGMSELELADTPFGADGANGSTQ